MYISACGVFLLLLISYQNPLIYSVVLLSFSIFFLLLLSLHLNLTVLSFLLITIVYVGAIIIFIGYICAVTPNLRLERTLLTPILFIFGLFLPLSFLSLGSSYPYPKSSSASVSLDLVRFFYSSHGSLLFLLLICMIFFTLLMATSHYLRPKGPFRSI